MKYEKKAEQKKPPSWEDTAVRLGAPVLALSYLGHKALEYHRARQQRAANAAWFNGGRARWLRQVEQSRRGQLERIRAANVNFAPDSNAPTLTHARTALMATPTGRHRMPHAVYTVRGEMSGEL